jgi:hypothetical protein
MCDSGNLSDVLGFLYYKHQQVADSQSEQYDDEQSPIILIRGDQPRFRVIRRPKAVTLNAKLGACAIITAEASLKSQITA